MANEKIIEPYRDLNSILSTEATAIQTNNTNGHKKELAPHGTDGSQNVEGIADKVRNSTEPSTPSPTPGPEASYSVFSPRMKSYIVVMTVFGTLFSPFSSFIYITALTPIATSYHRSLSNINFTVTIYQVMQAISPLFFGDLSDQLGRRPVYLITFTIYIAANIGLALQNNYAALMVLRALQSTGCSATVAIGSAVVTDITTSAERGGFITAVQASVMFAPALAPVIGGILTQYLGWRSTFWFLIIAAGIFLLIYVPFLPEVSVKLCGNFCVRPPRLTCRQTARALVDNGSIPPPKLNASLVNSQWRNPANLEAQTGSHEPLTPKKLHRRIPVPNIMAAIMIIFEKDVGILMFFMSLFVAANYCMLVPLQSVMRKEYDFNDLQVGLCYIPYSIGSIVGAVIVGKSLNWNYARVAKNIGVSADRKVGNDLRRFPIERARLDLMWPWILLAVAMLIAWGYVVDSGANLAAPLVVLFFAGASMSGPVSVLTTLLTDLYPQNPGRVSSSFNLTRAAMSSVGTSVVQYIIDAWGYGYTYLFLGLLLAFFSPCVLIVRKWGPKWREERYQRFERASGRTPSS